MSRQRKIVAILVLVLIGCNQPTTRLHSKLNRFELGWITLTGMEAIPVTSTLPIYPSDIRELADRAMKPKSEIPYCHTKYRVEFEKIHLKSLNALVEALDLEYCWNGSARVTFRDTGGNREYYEIEGSELNRVLTRYFEENDGKWITKSFDLHNNDVKMAYADLNRSSFLTTGTRFLCDTVVGSMGVTFRDTKANHALFDSIQNKYCIQPGKSKGCGE